MENRDEIKKILYNHPEIKECDVAYAVGLSPQTLNYQLNHAHKFDVELEKDIYAYFKKRGILTNSKEECVMLNDLFLEFTSISTQHVSILANEIRKTIMDGRLTPDERIRLKKKVNDMQENYTAKIVELRALIKG